METPSSPGWPDHEPIPWPPSPDQARDFEATLLKLLAVDYHWRRGQAGTATDVELRGRFPASQLVIAFTDHSKQQRIAAVDIWDAHWHDPPPGGESPAGLGGLIASNWLDASIVKDDITPRPSAG